MIEIETKNTKRKCFDFLYHDTYLYVVHINNFDNSMQKCSKIHLITCFRHKIIAAWYYQEFLIIAGPALSDELVKFLKTRHFDWITLQNLVLFAEIVQTTFYCGDLQIRDEIK